MLTENTSRWLSFAANLAILVGLVLVAVELNQNSQLTRTALIAEGSALENQIWTPLAGELPGEIIAKAVECPQSLTYADFIALDGFLYTSFNDVYREYELNREGLFTEEEWKAEVEAYAHWFPGNDFGRTWWDEVGRYFFEPDFSAYVDEQLAKAGEDSYAHWLNIRARLVPGEEMVLSVLCRLAPNRYSQRRQNPHWDCIDCNIAIRLLP
jgi:hypothetical protein